MIFLSTPLIASPFAGQDNESVGMVIVIIAGIITTLSAAALAYSQLRSRRPTEILPQPIAVKDAKDLATREELERVEADLRSEIKAARQEGAHNVIAVHQRLDTLSTHTSEMKGELNGILRTLEKIHQDITRISSGPGSFPR